MPNGSQELCGEDACYLVSMPVWWQGGEVTTSHSTASVPHASVRRHLPIRAVALHSHFPPQFSHLKNGGGDELY